LLKLYEHQQKAVNELKTGSILVGGVGSGKSLTAISYYYYVECGGKEKDDGFRFMERPKDLYIITTAAKRDTLDWERECLPFLISRAREVSISNVLVTVDSWNNIGKYIKVKDAFFIFDEQRVVGSGAWVKSFLKITKQNNWILLSATPGDTWMDYIPAFIANGFYKNRTEFIREHVVYNTFTKYPKVDHYVEQGKLIRLRNQILVMMPYEKPTTSYTYTVDVSYDEEIFNTVMLKRWNPYKNEPIKDISELCYTMRKVVNSDLSRYNAIKDLIDKHQKIIVFYNFNYELDILRMLSYVRDLTVAEYNGHKHEPVPKTEKWVYLVQYTAGAEGWNCIETNVIIFYSQNYSYRATTQAAGRIDRLNTPFTKLYYYTLRSKSPIDLAISKSLTKKKDFNEAKYFGSMLS
jgi:hypothetical protein